MTRTNRRHGQEEEAVGSDSGLATALLLERLDRIQESLSSLHVDVKILQEDLIKRTTYRKIFIWAGSAMVSAIIWCLDKVISIDFLK